jgi:hypothetical protein
MSAERRTRYEQLAFIWLRLLHNCENAKDCANFARQSTTKLKNDSDKRDVATAKAENSPDDIPVPPDPWPLESFKPPLQRYETTLKQLFAVQDKLIWAKFKREQTAANLLEEAKTKYTAVDSDVIQGLIFANPPNGGCIPLKYAAFSNGKGSDAETTSADTDKLLSQVLEIDAANQKKNVENLRAELDKKKDPIKTLKNVKQTCN